MAASRRPAVQAAAEVSRIGTLQPYGVQIWMADVDDPQAAQWSELALLLDAAEQARSRQFKRTADRRAYVLAHALRRAALARALAVAPEEIAISHDALGKPILLGAAGRREIFFSHSRSRGTVVCAVTDAGPIGIDVEFIDAAIVDFDLLAPFVALPDAMHRQAELGPDPARQFFFYWTALEAFWKAAGTGLSSAHPRIHCRKTGIGEFEVALDADASSRPRARLVRLDLPAHCSAALALYEMPERSVTQELGIEWPAR